MNGILSLVLAGGRVDELSVLTLSRPKSAMPFGGMYRVIDFCLSNLMHSGVENVGILSQYRSFSLLNHVGIGSWWDFVGRDRGATMLLPSTGHRASDWYKGTADAVYQNLEFVREKKPDNVLILSGDHIYKMDYAAMAAFHRDMDADLTIAFAPVAPERSSRFGVADLGDEVPGIGGRVNNYIEKPERTTCNWASMTIYLFKPQVLYDILAENAESNGSFEFGQDIIPNLVGKKRVFGYKFNGYWGYTRSIDEYWQTNMDLLTGDTGIDLEAWQVRTNLDHDKLRDRPPAQLGSRANIVNSLLHNGCKIDGHVENSILFAGVVVEPGAVVRDSILLFDTHVQSGAHVERTIVDVDARIGRGAVTGDGESVVANNSSPQLLSSGISLIGKGAVLPEGVRLGKNCIVAPGLAVDDFESTVYGAGLTIRHHSHEVIS